MNRTATPARPEPLFVGNQAWLDLVNTELVERGTRVDLLDTFPALVEWLVAASLLDEAAAADAVRRWAGTPEGERVLAEALALRGALRTLADALASERAVPPASVDAINRVLRERVCYAQLVASGGRYERRMLPATDAPVRLIAPVADSAAAFLARGDTALVRRCGNPACVLYFYDTTRNHARRFCSPATCGNRVKAAARYRRLRDERRAPRDR